MQLVKIALASLALFLSQVVFAMNLTEEEMERWLNSDDLNPPRYTTVNVNNGDLLFLNKKPLKPVHHHWNSITLYTNSLMDGWVKLEQCHRNMDRVQRVQVTFSKERVRDIKILQADAIEAAWVENHSVQLKNVKDNALLCIEAWTKALSKNKDGSYKLVNGPFMRKFLDGYYPIHVTLDVDFSATDLKLVQIEPIAQAGFKVLKKAKSVSVEAWFEGRLKTSLTFVN
ncbi:hypothetical protein JYT31_01465 [Beggiatoa alba]|nr:hypothetical protein [Beggiatoa alba]